MEKNQKFFFLECPKTSRVLVNMSTPIYNPVFDHLGLRA